MAEYMILIYEQEAPYENASPQMWASVMDAHQAFAKAVDNLGGSILRSNALQPTGTATSIRGGQVTDGPFVETKETLGGYYLIEAPDLDRALAIAAACPAPHGGVEVRPILDTSAG